MKRYQIVPIDVDDKVVEKCGKCVRMMTNENLSAALKDGTSGYCELHGEVIKDNNRVTKCLDLEMEIGCGTCINGNPMDVWCTSDDPNIPDKCGMKGEEHWRPRTHVRIECRTCSRYGAWGCLRVKELWSPGVQMVIDQECFDAGFEHWKNKYNKKEKEEKDGSKS